jgi:thiosulfate dehydrogenase
MLRGFITGVIASIVVVVVAAYALLQSGWVPANADAKPGGLELWVAGTSLEATLRNEAPRQPNPVALTDANLTEGVALFRQHCAICHGTAAGASSASPLAQGLYPSPPQFATNGVEDDADGISYWKISMGFASVECPPGGGVLQIGRFGPWPCS